MKPLGECTDRCVQGCRDNQSGASEPITTLFDAKADLLKGTRVSGPIHVAGKLVGKIEGGCHAMKESKASSRPCMSGVEMAVAAARRK